MTPNIEDGGGRVLKIQRKRYVAWSSVIAGIFLIFGVALILQPERWGNTPSYANLLAILDAPYWGIIHLIVGAFLMATFKLRHVKWLFIASHTVAIALLGSWLIAFIVRYLTDEGTTIVNVVSWTVFLSLLIQSSVSLETAVITATDEETK